MKKLTKPMHAYSITSYNYFPQILYGMEVPCRWLQADWWGRALMGYPDLKLSFDNDSDDWLLYRQIEALGFDVKALFPIPVHWAARKALGEHFERARQMDKKQIPWDDQLRYVCRKYSLQLCQYLRPNDEHPLGFVDHMIYPLLLPDEELIYELQPKNQLPC